MASVRPLQVRHPRLARVLKVLIIATGITATVLAIAQDQKTVELRSDLALDSSEAPHYLAALVAADIVESNRYDVLLNGNQIFPAMLAAIDAARERISLETYVYEKGRVADQFTDALERAARRGVTVNVILDALGTSGMDPEHVKRLQNAGCRVLSFNPTSWYTLEDLNYRTHRKILVVDGTLAFTGGAGIADHWQGNAEDAEHWRDTHVRVEGSVARLLESAFYENFVGGGFTVTPALARAVPSAGTDDKAMVVRSSPSDGASDLKRLYLLAIAMARRSIDISSPYFVTDESTMWALADARRRGVRIRVLVESDQTDHRSVKYASRQAYEALLERGVEIGEFTPTMMHTKTMVVDDLLSIFGSANFDNRSLELNDEVNVAVFSRSLAARFRDAFEQDLRRAHQLSLDAWRQRPMMERVHEQFWSYFGELF